VGLGTCFGLGIVRTDDVEKDQRVALEMQDNATTTSLSHL
jgi:hypothetical protein